MKVPYIDLAAQHAPIRHRILEAVDEVLTHGQFILGQEERYLEEQVAKFCGTQYAVGVASGTDALLLSLRALGIGPGDEVITVPNTFLATAAAIALVGARPVFVDVSDEYNIDPALIEAAITPCTRAILPVHLTGRVADMDPIMEIAARRGLHVVEDAAQAIGAKYRGKGAGTFGIAGCLSFHPLKNLGACGDGGAILTDDEEFYAELLKQRNHGLRNRDETDFWSYNSRLDTLQAAILTVKLEYLAEWTEQRRANADFYRQRIGEVVRVPQEHSYEYCIYHTFVVLASNRNELQGYLASHGIDTKVHYPAPLHLQEAARDLGYQRGDFPVAESQGEQILSLPVYPELTQEQKDLGVEKILEFYA